MRSARSEPPGRLRWTRQNEPGPDRGVPNRLEVVLVDVGSIHDPDHPAAQGGDGRGVGHGRAIEATVGDGSDSSPRRPAATPRDARTPRPPRRRSSASTATTSAMASGAGSPDVDGIVAAADRIAVGQIAPRLTVDGHLELDGSSRRVGADPIRCVGNGASDRLPVRRGSATARTTRAPGCRRRAP